MTQPSFTPKIKKLVTLPLFKLDFDTSYYFRFISNLYLGKQIEGRFGKDGQPQEPPTLVDVVNLETGDQGQVIVPAVARNELHEKYVDGVKGHCFALKIINAGKRYHLAQIAEIEDPAAGAETAEEVEKANKSLKVKR